MDKIQQLLKKQIQLSQAINTELDQLREDYQALLQKNEGKPGSFRPQQMIGAPVGAAPVATVNVVAAANFDLRVINTSLQAELQSKQAEIIHLEMENERLRFLLSAYTSTN
ncbi:hypothetical protein [Siphonobacter sp. SORGH_AS_1065]|uniref:hypothetical protein n=1 Tax=Siphonobacter sp. SORGH_AS_1065 TaxID=3041795 RepID=UPI002789D058|nr:hypothetical protein [Siphonobacter sp. SORGH_AS_1065]MDQ1087180.1 cell shape-determining protein MreC [Siphonobacter sp. SORGH_AS_1065]